MSTWSFISIFLLHNNSAQFSVNFSTKFFSTQIDKLVLYNNGVIYLKGFEGQGIVEIYSIIGNKIYAFELQNLNEIELSYPLKAGNMYIIRVISTKKAETFKIVA